MCVWPLSSMLVCFCFIFLWESGSCGLTMCFVDIEYAILVKLIRQADLMTSETMGVRARWRYGVVLETLEISHVCVLLPTMTKFNEDRRERRCEGVEV